jgi:enoyl-CoA hydratase/carnithine racemase
MKEHETIDLPSELATATRPAYRFIRLRGPDERGALTIELANPARRNAIGPQMVNEILHALEGACFAEEVRSIVLTGEGKAFSAGGDFAQMSHQPTEGDELPHTGDYADLLLAMVRAPKPIVARVNGHALGGGLGLVAASHFAVGVKDAKLGTPEIDVGLFPMMIMAVLRRIVPLRRLTQMMLFGERLDAEQAVAAGILTMAVDEGEIDQAVAAITARIADKSPVTVRHGLEAMAAQADLPLEAALRLLRERLALCLATADAQEGLMAFLEKRKPVWKGR